MVVRPSVLVVDDNVPLARAFALALERAGYAVRMAHSAEEGLRLAESVQVSAIVLDLRMPFINGAGFLYRLRAFGQHRHTPVLVVTGGAVDEEMRADLAELGAVLRFKPIGLHALIGEVDALLDPPAPSMTAVSSHAILRAR